MDGGREEWRVLSDGVRLEPAAFLTRFCFTTKLCVWDGGPSIKSEQLLCLDMGLTLTPSPCPSVRTPGYLR